MSVFRSYRFFTQNLVGSLYYTCSGGGGWFSNEGVNNRCELNEGYQKRIQFDTVVANQVIAIAPTASYAMLVSVDPTVCCCNYHNIPSNHWCLTVTVLASGVGGKTIVSEGVLLWLLMLIVLS